jgi:hypothetical protein
MAGGLAWQAKVTGGGFLHPMGSNARDARAETWQKDLKNREVMCVSSSFIKLWLQTCWTFDSPHSSQKTRELGSSVWEECGLWLAVRVLAQVVLGVRRTYSFR